MLLLFKKEIIEAARRADKAIINVVANETWAELKILVPMRNTITPRDWQICGTASRRRTREWWSPHSR